ncbi:conserved Plasmodium protein, unknown function [Plasmodium gallinaceum]|uniref:DUF8019 domain-containing protein n=1 Tax=Plasmodium gallinaceum TaxID=5849 RepID=A0A1J1GTS2_PLAGA|nr:conserved Plasmodium protein, unknown function [Plasmodium gallinaceum]CRG94443.1 conserved Plasmodium protein, unknown function [Plasmodium gallinaceum]
MVIFILFFFIYNIKLAKLEKSLFNYLSEISFSEPFENLFEKCLEIPNNICLGGTTTPIISHSIHNGLIGKWTFDDIYALDYSSNKNHMHKLIRNGPSFNGHGYSGAFIGDISGFVPSGETLKTTQFTIVFWIYLLERSTSHFRNIISQIDNKEEKIAILLHPHTTKISVRIMGKDNSNEGLSSIGHIPLRRWTNIAITLNEKQVEIYVNGVFDNSVFLKSKIVEKRGNITIGKNSNYSSFNGYLDELHFYNRSLNVSEIKSFSIPSITGIYDTNFVHIGCLSCDYDTAKSDNLCKKNYELCSLFNLYNGGIHYARINGILTEKSNIWASDISEDTIEKGEKRIALCCKLYKDNT